ncbi:DUF6083 domain-containing protein [Streptomyces chattanoogensis]|uniref:DUF6083 domain-containing protein n=1 Tax=Streptomyces chattanoogensis TaxID=66876 RepID=UPI0036A6D0AB
MPGGTGLPAEAAQGLWPLASSLRSVLHYAPHPRWGQCPSYWDMCTKSPVVEWHWDGSPKHEEKQPRSRWMRVHRSSASTALRWDARVRCRYCGHQMEYFDRFDGGRIPMMPHQFRSVSIPERLRWSVDNGVAYIGDSGRLLCWVPHPAVCPMVEHEDDDPELEQARMAHLLWTRRWIESEEFTPELHESTVEADVADQHVELEAGAVRHVVRYASWTWLGPDAVDRIQCVARAASTGARCQNRVLSSDTYEGGWEQTEVPVPPGRAGQESLWAGMEMWVYQLHMLEPHEFKRWIRQRCTDHAPGASSVPDAIAPQWVSFDAWRHSDFILFERPHWEPDLKRQEHLLLSRLEPAQKPTNCAAAGCRNGTIMPVAAGWLCWQCAKKEQRRRGVHRRWQQSRDHDS